MNSSINGTLSTKKSSKPNTSRFTPYSTVTDAEIVKRKTIVSTIEQSVKEAPSECYGDSNEN